MLLRIKLILLSIIVITIFVVDSASAYWIWTPQTKKWINPKYAPKDTPKEQLLYAMDFYEAKEYKKALAEFKKIINYYERSEAASEAQYYMGRCYDNLGKPYPAFQAYQKVIDDYPFTQRTDEIIKRQFEIGERLDRGEKSKILGVPFKALPEQIIEVYKKVVSNAPYSKHAPRAQFRIGEIYKRIDFFEEARDAFQKIVEDYPDSDIASEAKFQVALCASAASGKSGYDQSLSSQAMEEFEEFAQEHPDSEFVKKAQEERRILMEKRAASHIETAEFYERIKKSESAALYYNKVLNEFPDSESAPKALERLEVINKMLKGKNKI
ncbi:outer membrane protein assembly factor BamD [Candidatus Omnitrophota bacterium]